MTEVQATKNIMAAHHNDLFPDGWWVSLYGYRLRVVKGWQWRKGLPRRTRTLVNDGGNRVELTQRFHVDTSLQNHVIVPEHAQWTFQRCGPGVYDRIALHAKKDGPLVDLHPFRSVTLSNPASSPVGAPSRLNCTADTLGKLKDADASMLKARGDEIVVTLHDWEMK